MNDEKTRWIMVTMMTMMTMMMMMMMMMMIMFSQMLGLQSIRIVFQMHASQEHTETETSWNIYKYPSRSPEKVDWKHNIFQTSWISRSSTAKLGTTTWITMAPLNLLKKGTSIHVECRKWSEMDGRTGHKHPSSIVTSLQHWSDISKYATCKGTKCGAI